MAAVEVPPVAAVVAAAALAEAVVVVAAEAVAAVAADVVVAAEVAGDSKDEEEKTMRLMINLRGALLIGVSATLALSSALLPAGIGSAVAQTTEASHGSGFTTPQEAVSALIEAAAQFDTKALQSILGPSSFDIVNTGEPARDKEMATEFANQARTKQSLVTDPRNPGRMTLNVGEDEWPFPVPLIKLKGKWYFDSRTGRQEVLVRRIGRNELDAIEICRGYVEAQHEYALMKHGESGVNRAFVGPDADPGEGRHAPATGPRRCTSSSAGRGVRR